jgi:hypothetical protein
MKGGHEGEGGANSELATCGKKTTWRHASAYNYLIPSIQSATLIITLSLEYTECEK